MIKLKQLILENKMKNAEEFLKSLIKNSTFEGRVYAAGGYVRDEIMGKQSKDLDVVVDMPDGGIEFANWATQKMGNYKEGANPVLFPAYGTSKFTMKGVTYKGEDLSDIDIEAVAPRAEEYIPGSRKPKVKGASLKADAERRDLTANSLFKNISTGEIVDLTGRGKEDLQKGIARTPLDPDQTFSDDPLRMMRLVRFFVKYNWDVPMDQLRALKRNASQIQNISMERVQDELNKIFNVSNTGKALKLIRNSGIGKYIMPDVSFSTEKLKAMQGNKPAEVKMAILLHDLPKQTVENTLKKLKYPNHIISAVSNAVALQYFFDSDVSLSNVRKFRRIAGRYAEVILGLINSLNRPIDTDKIFQQLDAIKNDPIKPPVGGNELIAIGIKPGPQFKQILDKIQDQFDNDPNTPTEKYLEIAKQF